MINIFLVDKERKIYPIIIRALKEAGYSIRRTQRQHQTGIIEVEEKGQRENRELSIEQAVRELEDFFVGNNEKELYKFMLAAVERPLIESVLNRTAGNQLKAAQILGINRNTLHAKIKKLGIKITPKAFGKDRRLPITNRYRELQDELLL
ncbi:MAG: helix-turn-helix domain-containing protein [bacterium]